LSSNLETEAAWQALIDKGKHMAASEYWQTLEDLRINEDLVGIRRQLKEILAMEPIPSDAVFLYFGIFEIYHPDTESSGCSFYISGGKHIDENDQYGDFLCNPSYFPNERFIESTTLNQINNIYWNLKVGIQNEKNKLEFNYEKLQEVFIYFLTLGTVAIIARAICRVIESKFRIYVGFDNGDFFEIPSFQEGEVHDRFLQKSGSDVNKSGNQKEKGISEIDSLLAMDGMAVLYRFIDNELKASVFRKWLHQMYPVESLTNHQYTSDLLTIDYSNMEAVSSLKLRLLIHDCENYPRYSPIVVYCSGKLTEDMIYTDYPFKISIEKSYDCFCIAFDKDAPADERILFGIIDDEGDLAWIPMIIVDYVGYGSKKLQPTAIQEFKALLPDGFLLDSRSPRLFFICPPEIASVNYVEGTSFWDDFHGFGRSGRIAMCAFTKALRRVSTTSCLKWIQEREFIFEFDP
jgi:hypothetical protein